MTGEINNKQAVPELLHQLGLIHAKQGNYKEAEMLYNECLRISKEDNDKAGVASSLHQLGTIHLKQENYTKAEELLNESLKIAVEIDSKEGIASNLVQLGRLYGIKGDIKSEVKNYVIAAGIFREVNSSNEKIILGDLAKLKAQLGEPEFNKYYKQAVKELQSN